MGSERMRRGLGGRRSAVLGLLAGTAWLACLHTADEGAEVVAEAASPLSVYTVSYPLQYFAERVGGEDVAVVFRLGCRFSKFDPRLSGSDSDRQRHRPAHETSTALCLGTGSCSLAAGAPESRPCLVGRL